MRLLPLGVYALSVGLYVPALLTNYLGVCPGYAQGQSCFLVFWDFYESTFVGIALLDFIPLFITAELLGGGKFSLYHIGFMVTGAWMLILAMPDVFLSYVPWAWGLQTWQYYFNDYNAYLFGNASICLLLVNLLLFSVLVRGKRDV